MAKKLTPAEISKNLNQVAELLEQADALLQKTVPHSDELYYIHTQIENAKDDVVDMIIEVDHNQPV